MPTTVFFFPLLGMEPWPWEGKYQVLTTKPPGISLSYYFKCFMYINSANPYSNIVRRVLLSPAIYRGANRNRVLKYQSPDMSTRVESGAWKVSSHAPTGHGVTCSGKTAGATRASPDGWEKSWMRSGPSVKVFRRENEGDSDTRCNNGCTSRTLSHHKRITTMCSN